MIATTPVSLLHRPPVLLLAITAHGYGHAAQTAPVVNRLRELCPGLELVIVADLSRDWLQGRFHGEFHHVSTSTDPGLPMLDPLTVDWPCVVSRYNAFVDDADSVRDRFAEILSAHSVDMVLADVPWLPLETAADAGVPAVALSSLNWADILRAVPSRQGEVASLVSIIESAYRRADLFIRPEPTMPMEWLCNAESVGLIAMQGRAQPKRVRDYLGMDEDQVLGLSQFGGIEGMSSIKLPCQDRVQWMLSRSTNAGSLVSCAEEVMTALGMTIVDLIASVDLMLTKPGYGSFAEAACHGTRVLSVQRSGWPEARYLEAWLQQRVPMISITPEQLYAGNFATELGQLLRLPSGLPVPADGAEQAARLLLERLPECE